MSFLSSMARIFFLSALTIFVTPAAEDKQEDRLPSGFEMVKGSGANTNGWASEILHTDTGIEMIYVAPGEFMMGSPSSEEDRQNDEIQHKVKLTKGYYIGKYEVTQGQWKKVMGNTPSEFKDDNLPVEQVSWDDCKSFCEKLGSGFRLPTESEWEYASRAGSTTAYCFGDDGNSWFNDDLSVYGWFESNGDGTTHLIGQKKPNAWGLYDMHGNVWEWCSDWCGNYTSDEVTDPTGAAAGLKRVYRGGSWYSDAVFCRSANRDGIAPGSRNRYIGFRPAVSAPTVQ